MAVAASTPARWETEGPVPESALELRDDLLPVLLARSWGVMDARQALELIRFVDAGCERAIVAGSPAIVIFDATHAARTSALVREMLVDWLRASPYISRRSGMRAFVVTPNLIIRGVVASVRWATGSCACVNSVSSLDDAIAAATVLLRERGIDVPEVLRAEQDRGRRPAAGSGLAQREG